MSRNQELRELIQEARQQIRAASGEATQEEIAAIDRKRQENDLGLAVYTKLGGTLAYMMLRLEVFSRGSTAVAKLSCEGKTFHLSLRAGIWQLSIYKDGVETAIADIKNGDALFKQRILAAIGDYI
jgi:hypothetical protein